MPRVIPDATYPLDQIRYARRGPQAGLVSEHLWALLQLFRNTLQIGGAEPRLASGASSFLQSGPAFLLHLFGPTMHRLPVHAQNTRYLCLTLSLLEHPRGP